METKEPFLLIWVLRIENYLANPVKATYSIEVSKELLFIVLVGSVTIDCRNGEIDPMSRAFLEMAGVFSSLELAIIRACVRSGMEQARSKGRRIGRPQTTKEDIPAAFMKHYTAFEEGKMNVSELARVCGLSRLTVYKYMKMME